jgi:MoxR-like ATPase
MKSLSSFVGLVTGELNKVVIGQGELVRQALATILCGGHALIEGVPGVAKTLTVRSISRVLNVGFRRIQCSSDLMPADIVGTNIFDAKIGDFRLHRGPLFTELLLVDEINRMPPRTQAALLEAMEERQATIDGVSYPLPRFFTVFATQNPVEFEGIYPLPEAQLDRFLLKIVVGYPDLAAEVKILSQHENNSESQGPPTPDVNAISAEELELSRETVAKVRIEPSLTEYIARLAHKTRQWPAIRLGASPRAAIAVLRVSKAFAAMEERDYVIPDDIKAAAECTWRHRILLNPEAELEGVSPDQALEQVIRAVEVPK